MAIVLTQWRVYCEDDQTYHTVWLNSSDPAPTTCPVNTNHTITSNLTSNVTHQNVEDRIMIEEEEIIKTQGYFKCLGRTFDIDGNVNSTTLDIIENPYNTTILDGWFYSQSDQVGDSVDGFVSMVTGGIASNISSGNNSVQVTQTVMDNAAIGFEMTLTDGVNTDDMGEVINIDTNTNTLTFSKTAAHSFSFASPTYVNQTVKIVDNLKINVPNVKYAFAQKKQRGKGIPPNVPVQIQYKNITGNSKTFSYNIEYMY